MEYKSRELERKFQNKKSDGNINTDFHHFYTLSNP